MSDDADEGGGTDDVTRMRVKRVSMSSDGVPKSLDVNELRDLVAQAVTERAEAISRADGLENALRLVLGVDWLPADLVAACAKMRRRYTAAVALLSELHQDPHRNPPVGLDERVAAFLAEGV